MRLDGKVALVTGGASGIGEACARRFGADGAAVVIVDRDPAPAERVAASLQADGVTTGHFIADLTDADEAQAAVSYAVSTFGGLHLALNCAGISGPFVPIEDVTTDDWRSVQSINLDGVFYCLRAELRHMLSHGGGAIVNMGSMFSTVARDNYAAYVSAKHGVLGLTRAAAIDCATRGVRINCVGPAVIDTPLLRKSLTDVESQALADLNPSLRFGQADEVANLVVWLCSDEASFVNGSFYAVDGGFTAR